MLPAYPTCNPMHPALFWGLTIGVPVLALGGIWLIRNRVASPDHPEPVVTPTPSAGPPQVPPPTPPGWRSPAVDVIVGMSSKRAELFGAHPEAELRFWGNWEGVSRSEGDGAYAVWEIYEVDENEHASGGYRDRFILLWGFQYPDDEQPGGVDGRVWTETVRLPSDMIGSESESTAERFNRIIMAVEENYWARQNQLGISKEVPMPVFDGTRWAHVFASDGTLRSGDQEAPWA